MASTEMGVTDRLFTLRDVPPFDRLRESDLALIAEVSKHRRFAAGDVVRQAGVLSPRLQIVTSGQVEAEDGRAVDAVIGLGSLLFGREAPTTLVAGEDGAETLEVSRGHAVDARAQRLHGSRQPGGQVRPDQQHGEHHHPVDRQEGRHQAADELSALDDAAQL